MSEERRQITRDRSPGWYQQSLRPWMTASAFLLAGSAIANGQWFGPGNNPATTSPPRPMPVHATRPQPTVTPAALAPRQLPPVNPYHAQPAAIPNPNGASDPFSNYPATSSPPVAVQPNSPVEQLLATAAEQERVGNSWQAINSYRQALELDPRNHRALLSYARMKHRARDFEGAVMLYHQMLQFYPQDAVALNDLGLCYARMGDTPQAVATLQQAILREPNSKRYRNNLAVVFVEAGHSGDAYQTLVPVHGTVVANYNVAWLLARLGQNDQAVEYLNATLLADPSFTAAVDLLTQVEPTTSPVATLPRSTAMATPVDGNSMSIYQSATSYEGGSKIELRSGQLALDEVSRATAAIYQFPVGELPPDSDDYRIPGIDD